MSMYDSHSFYTYDSSFRFALTESHEELTNIVKNKLWYIKKKEDLIHLLNVCFKETHIPLKTIEMVVAASSYKPMTLFKQLNNPFWLCMINNQEDKFEFLLDNKFTFYIQNKSLMQALVEFNHLNLFKIAATKHTPIDKQTIQSLFLSRFEQCLIEDYAQAIVENYSINTVKKILNFTHLIEGFNNDTTLHKEQFEKRKMDFVVFLETHILLREKKCDIIDTKSTPKNQRLKL
jgi:hypothetical protein